jgi:thiosulfate/3-mercaptopyruvate sulfurtransferase
MSDTQLPIIIDPESVKPLFNQKNIAIIDLCQAETYIQNHIPGAVFLEYAWIVRADKPRMGLLPDVEQLSRILSAYGIEPDTHVIAYDDEGGGRAARFLWTLDCVGHHHYSLINGGLHAWANEGHEMTNEIHFPHPTTRVVQMNDQPLADKQFILDHYRDNDVVILDTRSPHEYTGTKVFAARGGHIPGAVNYEWTLAMDQQHNLRLKPTDLLRQSLEAQGITQDKTIVCHCQSHHRSAHTYVMLKSLGYEKIKGYPGSWSDWGNDPATPIEQ